MERVLLLLGAGLSDTYQAHTSIPINLFYRGGSSNYLLRGSVNNTIMATGTSTVIHVNFHGRRGWWSGV